ncbi:MAG: hypothetical protein K9M80_01320 [Candidatus Marinimicrobia bacterium]|nr:hypothetical protein [Candidatus Neomarinimicrobiota bacterium]
MMYQPGNPFFPVIVIQNKHLIIEIFREIFSLTVVFLIAYLSGNNYREKFAALMFTFGLWDIFYYIWLFIIHQWPPSWMTWDVLYRVPIMWTGPVIAPLIVSVCLVSSALIIFYIEHNKIEIEFTSGMWIFEIIAGTGVIISFVWNSQSTLRGAWPGGFPWWLFLPSILLGLIVFYYALIKCFFTSSKNPQ